MDTADQVLIIEDSQQRRHDLSTIIEFMGYRTRAVSSAYWEDAIRESDKDGFCALFLGGFSPGRKFNAGHDCPHSELEWRGSRHPYR